MLNHVGYGRDPRIGQGLVVTGHEGRVVGGGNGASKRRIEHHWIGRKGPNHGQAKISTARLRLYIVYQYTHEIKINTYKDDISETGDNQF